MKQTEVSSTIFETFSPAFRKHVHLLLAWGYENAKPQMCTKVHFKLTETSFQGLEDEGIHKRVLKRLKRLKNKGFVLKNEFWEAVEKQIGKKLAVKDKKLILKYAHTDDEETITGLIYQEIDNILCSGCNARRWCINYSVKNEIPIPGRKRVGKKRRRIDILIEYVTRTGRPKYVFEAKPLNYSKNYQRENNYIGDKGMGRFIKKGEYLEFTQNYPEVGMLGYVLSDTNEQWCTKLKEAIEREQNILRLKSSQYDIAVIEEFPLEWISEHERENVDRPLKIYHILLDCRS